MYKHSKGNMLSCSETLPKNFQDMLTNTVCQYAYSDSRDAVDGSPQNGAFNCSLFAGKR